MNMATTTSTTRKRTNKSATKDDLKETVKPVLQEIEDNASAALDPEKIRAQAAVERVLAKADAAVSVDVQTALTALKEAVSKEADTLCAKLAEEAEKYRNLQEAVKLKSEELKQIYEMDASASALLALIEAQRRKQTEFEAENSQWQADFEARKERQEAALSEEAEEKMRQRTRQEEEYNYKWERGCAQKKAKFEDELNALQKDIATRRSDFEAECERRRAELDERESAVEAREDEYKALKEQVDKQDATIAAAVAKAEKELTARLKGEFDLREQLSQKEFEGDRKVLEAKLAALQNQNEALSKQLEDVSARQEKAYAQVQDIATKAVANCGKTLITTPASPSIQPATKA
jgi:DNA repair exonuclease SbcCD ATPase subunit